LLVDLDHAYQPFLTGFHDFNAPDRQVPLQPWLRLLELYQLARMLNVKPVLPLQLLGCKSGVTPKMAGREFELKPL